MSNDDHPNNFIDFLATYANGDEDPDRIPTLGEVSATIGVSVPKLREQLEVARALGFVRVKPRTGIKRIPYRFSPAVQRSLLYALALDPGNFQAFSELRSQVEAGFWIQAVKALKPADIQELEALVRLAWSALDGSPVKIPHREHRQLHMTFFKRLDNPFVAGLLEAYWEAYEAVELNHFADYRYLREVWTFHERMVQSVAGGDFEDSLQAFIEHTKLLLHRPASSLDSALFGT
jgi:DNA-binding FadR family transcriptional regulator